MNFNEKKYFFAENTIREMKKNDRESVSDFSGKLGCVSVCLCVCSRHHPSFKDLPGGGILGLGGGGGGGGGDFSDGFVSQPKAQRGNRSQEKEKEKGRVGDSGTKINNNLT